MSLPKRTQGMLAGLVAGVILATGCGPSSGTKGTGPSEAGQRAGEGQEMTRDDGSVSAGEKQEIMGMHEGDRESGYEHEWLYDLWQGTEARDKDNNPIKLVRVRFHQRQSPEKVNDAIYVLRNGKLPEKGVWFIRNAWGDDWKPKAPTVDLDRLRRGLPPAP